MIHSAVDHDEIRHILHYIPTTGVLLWKNPRGRVAKGSVAGSVIKGVRWIRLASYLMKASDIIYFWMTGNWEPTRCSDGNGDNLVWSNIEVVPETCEKITSAAPYTYIRWEPSGEWCVSGNMGASVATAAPITGDTCIRFVQAVFSDGAWRVVANDVPEAIVDSLKLQLEGL